jgi:mono/diheme cytochrome c family protein
VNAAVRPVGSTFVFVVVVLAAALIRAATVAAGDPLGAQSTAAARRTLQDGVFTAEQAARGRIAYDRRCAECHMPDLAGHEYAGALAGYGFQLKWQDATLGELLGRIRSMPLGRPRSLTDQEDMDILAYVLQKNTYPEGTSELAADIVSTWPPIRIERVLRSPDGQ